MSTPEIFTEADVRAAVTMTDAIESTRRSFLATEAGALSTAAPWHLDVENRGEVHVKGAYLFGEPFFSVKTSTGFPGNAAAGLPTSSGYTTVFDAATGQPVALLLDGGYLTELRTGAAGAVALDLLAPLEIDTLVVIGTGGQARFQIAGALQVRHPRLVRVLGRDSARADSLAAWVGESFDVRAEANPLSDGVPEGQAIVTVTGARSPILQRQDVLPGTHVTAVGSDGPGKRELDPALVSRADLFAVDDVAQSERLGELKGLDRDAVTLGALLHDGAPAWTEDRISVADLTGTGAQDAAIATVAVGRLLRSASTRGAKP
jgi:ornithine cyclodeaminase